MKNPFEKEDNSSLIIGMLIGSLAAGAATYLFMTKRGATIRGEVSKQLNTLLKKIKGGESATENVEDHSKDYLHKKHKAPKTDREDLLKHHILAE
ncbi:YtxH domain-containing protein [Mucilaginibacter ginkgonis]|uniref:YtxH domain-containing protein n=1 Tax=Mucilaginibacter ginkgonis TaxID=2682091 RepID=A0A6I4IPK5_9SPHI|nr:YtxH domain-containing protein [Mucilaginibacter ginkgonis]QQL49059.1 YtxH domain-containing protein [Mucilaginibacter ginkgonis]